MGGWSEMGWFYGLKATGFPNRNMTLAGSDGEVGGPGDGARIIL